VVSRDPLELVPGVRRIRPDDHFMLLSETDASPMHVGALLVLEVSAADKPGLADAFRRQLAERLPATPMLARLVEAPGGFDSDVWADVDNADLAAHVVAEDAPLAGDDALYAAVAERNMMRLDLSRPPFFASVFAGLPGDRAAIYFRMHHSLADGIGFQEVLRLLSDELPPQTARVQDATLPSPEGWQDLAEARFTAEALHRTRQSAARKSALAALEAYRGERSGTPKFAFSGPTSAYRAYAPFALPLGRFKVVAQRFGATVNDLFLACASQALREYLLALGELPAAPLVVNSARSYRRPEHGAFGNRIVALHPHLATHIPDPLDRLRAIQASMAAEMRRTPHDESLLDALEKPYGARDRRAAFAERLAGGARIIPGNLTLSNVPGPAGERSFMGYRQLHNFPVPIIGSGRFLNITSRRSGENLDMGVIADAAKIPDAAPIARRFAAAFADYEQMET